MSDKVGEGQTATRVNPRGESQLTTTYPGIKLVILRKTVIKPTYIYLAYMIPPSKTVAFKGRGF